MMPFSYYYEVRRNTPSDIWLHMPVMHKIASEYDAPKIIELGTRSGNSTAVWLAVIEAKGGHLWSADLDEPKVPPGWLAAPFWTRYRGDDCGDEIVSAITDGTGGEADVLFIDTSHFYDHTMRELELYVPLVRKGGVVLMHDTEWMGCEVAKALDDYCPAHGLTWKNHEGNNGLGEIRIPEDHGAHDLAGHD